jgi:hypothetical protein
MKKRTTNENKDPLPASDPTLAIKILDPKGQETREGACERGGTIHHGDAELHGMALVESGEEKYNAWEEAT